MTAATGGLFENLNSPLTSHPARPTKIMPGFDFGVKKAFTVQPPSERMSLDSIAFPGRVALRVFSTFSRPGFPSSY